MTVPSTVVVTTTVEGAPTTITETKEVPVTTVVPTTVTDTTVMTTAVPTTVTNNVTTTETATETTTATTTTVAPAKPQVEVNGSTIEYWQQKGDPIAIKIRDENVEDGSLKFRKPAGINGATLSDEGRKLELPGVGTYTIKNGAVEFTPEADFTGDVTPVEIDYTRTDGAEVVTPIKVLGHYNDCGCKTPENPENPDKPAEPSNPSGSSETPKSGDTSSTPGSSENPEPSKDPKPSEPSSSPTEGSAPATVTVTETLKPVTTTVNGTPTTITETQKAEPSTVVTTVSGTPTTVTETQTPGVVTVTETTTVKGDAGAEAKAVIDRCFGNAVRSPLLYLLPLGILAQVGGKIVQPYIASYQAQLDAFNAEINRQIQEQYQLPDFGAEIGKRMPRNQQIDELIARVNEANGQLQQLAAQPEVQQLGKAAGVILATVAAGAVLYDWCSNEPGKAFTAVGEKGDGAGNRLGRGESSSR